MRKASQSEKDSAATYSFQCDLQHESTDRQNQIMYCKAHDKVGELEGVLLLLKKEKVLPLAVNSEALLSKESLLLALLPLSCRGSVFCEMPSTDCKPNIVFKVTKCVPPSLHILTSALQTVLQSQENTVHCCQCSRLDPNVTTSCIYYPDVLVC